MALDRLPIDEPLAAYLDGLGRVPDDLRELYREMEGDEWARMMTHPDLGALLEALVRATFKNFDAPRDIRFVVKREDGHWVVDEIR